MFTVYVLYSAKFDKIYIGHTSDLEKRFLIHNQLVTKVWAFKFRPWKIVHTEEYESKGEAMKERRNLNVYRAGSLFGNPFSTNNSGLIPAT